MVFVKDLLDQNIAGNILTVNGCIVWDYKILNNKLFLIWEHVSGSDRYEPVVWREIKSYIRMSGLGEDIEIVPETGGTEFKSVSVEDPYVKFLI